MLRLMLLTFAVFCAQLLLVSPVKADALADAHQEIAAAYAREDAAISRKDIKAATACYTSDFIDVDEKGHKSDLAATKTQMQSVFHMVQDLKLRQRILTLTLNGNQARVSGSASMEGLMPDSSKKLHKVHKLVTTGSFMDIWIKSKRGWLKKQSRSIYATTTLDGQPLNQN